MLQNVKDFKSTAIGILAIVAALPQIDAVQQFTAISPKAAIYISTIGGLAAGILAVFGISTKPKV